jgi:hypothetical protein
MNSSPVRIDVRGLHPVIAKRERGEEIRWYNDTDNTVFLVLPGIFAPGPPLSLAIASKATSDPLVTERPGRFPYFVSNVAQTEMLRQVEEEGAQFNAGVMGIRIGVIDVT